MPKSQKCANSSWPGRVLQVAHRAAVEVPVFIEHAATHSLVLAGIHGDEVNGIEILRQCIAKALLKAQKAHFLWSM